MPLCFELGGFAKARGTVLIPIRINEREVPVLLGQDHAPIIFEPLDAVGDLAPMRRLLGPAHHAKAVVKRISKRGDVKIREMRDEHLHARDDLKRIAFAHKLESVVVDLSVPLVFRLRRDLETR